LVQIEAADVLDEALDASRSWVISREHGELGLAARLIEPYVLAGNSYTHHRAFWRILARFWGTANSGQWKLEDTRS
jgi:hypothetical protein